MKSGEMGDSLLSVLSLLDPAPATAEEKYRQLRRRMVRYFEWNNVLDPEEATDETICRVQRRLMEGVQIQTANPQSYFYGVAANVLREIRRIARESKSEPLDTWHESIGSREDVNKLERGILLRQCLLQLEENERELLLAYYSGKIQECCARFDLSPNGLRVRVCRIKKRLEDLMGNKKRKG